MYKFNFGIDIKTEFGFIVDVRNKVLLTRNEQILLSVNNLKPTIYGIIIDNLIPTNSETFVTAKIVRPGELGKCLVEPTIEEQQEDIIAKGLVDGIGEIAKH